MEIFTRKALRAVFSDAHKAKDIIAMKPKLYMDLIATNQALLELRLRANHEVLNNFSSEKKKYRRAIARLNFTLKYIEQYEEMSRMFSFLNEGYDAAAEEVVDTSEKNAHIENDSHEGASK